jgi:hypothetical protein
MKHPNTSINIVPDNVIDVGWRMGRTVRPEKVVFCVPCYPTDRPYPQTEKAFQDEKPFLKASGWNAEVIYQSGLPYISAARAMLLRRALNKDATVIFFVDQDISWKPGEATRLINTEGGLVAGTYRYKHDEEHYMGGLAETEEGIAGYREDGCLDALVMPAGFMKVTRAAVNAMIKAHPELTCGEASTPMFDMFSHGIMEGEWRGEDAAACLRWIRMGEKVWCLPDLEITHHAKDRTYPGNLAKYLERISGHSVANLAQTTIQEEAVKTA